MKRRDFLWASGNDGALAQNGRHAFALKQTLRIYGSGACCTWIPKNACSTLRFSVARANGCVADLSDIHWIHANNQTFNASSETAFQAPYTFVILRCPFARLYSAFINKFVDLDVQSWQLSNARGRSFHPHDLTFRMLLQTIQDMNMTGVDIHLRRQTDFLLFRRYDDYFALEQFSQAAKTIQQKAGLRLYDTRGALGHDTGKMAARDDIESPMDMAAADLLVLKRRGVIPSQRSMFDTAMAEIVNKVWASDMALYSKKFGLSALMAQFT